jgi:hypothetical protein
LPPSISANAAVSEVGFIGIFPLVGVGGPTQQKYNLALETVHLKTNYLYISRRCPMVTTTMSRTPSSMV